MILTIINLSLLAGLLIASIALTTVFLWLGLRWAKAPYVSLRRSLFATCLGCILQLPVVVGSYLVSPSDEALALKLVFVELIVLILIPIFVIGLVFRITFPRSLQAWLPTNLGSVIMFTFVLLVFRPFLIEAFRISSNSMAPTLLGDHWQGTCRECGSPAYCSPPSHQFASIDLLMICEKKLHITEPVDHDERVLSADRILVTRFLMPQRWDLAVFKNPENPSTQSVMRIVGLPGEVIIIKDGKVRANGEALIPPESIREITYLLEVDGLPYEPWGTVENPAKLGDDEYFVLGDFSARSNDSRLWRHGAPDHNPYAVPASNLNGVVSQIYWPPSRWKSFR